jgi:hypothetical protein
MNHAEAVDEIEFFADWDEALELFGIALNESGVQAEYLKALTCEVKASTRQLNDCQVSSVTREIDRVRTDPTANLEDTFAAPALKLSETGDMRLDEIFASFDLIKVAARPDRLWRVADVARTLVPVRRDGINRRRTRFSQHGLVLLYRNSQGVSASCCQRVMPIRSAETKRLSYDAAEDTLSSVPALGPARRDTVME